jgi:hypothetical protein
MQDEAAFKKDLESASAPVACKAAEFDLLVEDHKVFGQ